MPKIVEWICEKFEIRWTPQEIIQEWRSIAKIREQLKEQTK